MSKEPAIADRVFSTNQNKLSYTQGEKKPSDHNQHLRALQALHAKTQIQKKYPMNSKFDETFRYRWSMPQIGSTMANLDL